MRFPLLYIDPGTGSMLFTVLLGIIGAAIYSARMFALKLRGRLGGGKVKADVNQIPFVIFSDHKRYWNVFEPVCREMAARGRPMLFLTGSDDDPALSCDFEGFRAEYIGPGNHVFTRLNNLNAAVVLSTTPGLEVYQWKRAPKAKKYIHILHSAGEVTL